MGDAFIARRDEGSTFNKMLEIVESYAGTINTSTSGCNMSGGVYFGGRDVYICPTASYDGLFATMTSDMIDIESDYYLSGSSNYNVVYIYGKNVSQKTFTGGYYSNDGMDVRECKRYNNDLIGIVFSSRYDSMWFEPDSKFENGLYYLLLIRNSQTLR